MAKWAYYNNDFVLEKECVLPAADLAVQRGYGVFDFFRATAGKPLFLDAHLDRFYHSANALRLQLSKSEVELKTVIAEMLFRNALPHSGVKLTLTGGFSPDGFSIAQPNLIITEQTLSHPPAAFAQGIRLATYAHQRQLPHVKTIDYLMAIWLQPWLTEIGADDVLYFSDGQITECPRANFFVVTEDDRIATPDKNILKGITRARVLHLASEKAAERSITITDLKDASEAFITSTTKQVVPVIAIDGLTIGNGKPGRVTQWVAEQLSLEIEALV